MAKIYNRYKSIFFYVSRKSHALFLKKTLAWHHVSFNSEDQERIKGTEKASPIHTLFHR